MTLVCVEKHVLLPTVCPSWVKHLQKRIASLCWTDAESLTLCTFDLRQLEEVM